MLDNLSFVFDHFKKLDFRNGFVKILQLTRCARRPPRHDRWRHFSKGVHFHAIAIAKMTSIFNRGLFFPNGVLRRKERLSLQIVRIIREKVCRVLFGSARTRQQKLYYFNRTVIIKNNYVFIERGCVLIFKYFPT